MSDIFVDAVRFGMGFTLGAAFAALVGAIGLSFLARLDKVLTKPRGEA